jgi:two-component system nitrogen regulation response regulator GlnG
VTHEDAIASLVHQWAERQLEGRPEATDLHQRLLRLVEPPLLGAALARHRGQYAAAARHLGLHRVTLKRKVDESRKGG